MQEIPQEPRNEKLTVTLTASEKRAIEFFANVGETSEAHIVRHRMKLDELIAEWREARAKVAA